MNNENNNIESYPNILIISSNVISMSQNNGKTLLSLFKDYPFEKLSQLYFHNDCPEIKGINYFRITDMDVMKGHFNHSLRGAPICVANEKSENNSGSIKSSRIVRNSFTCLVREALWIKSWKSKQLISWLDCIKPDIIFFVAGDGIFTYHIVEYVRNRYSSRLGIYITDDYIIPRTKETVFDLIKRKKVFKYLKRAVSNANVMFTISEKMRIEYKQLFNKDSIAIFNIAPKREQVLYPENKKSSVVFTYAGSLYYKREDSLIEVAKTIQNINKREGSRALLQIYSNNNPSEKSLDKMNLNNTSKFCGFVNSTELQKVMANSDVLVFVESFETEQIEKTRLSLSTKISEYLSMGKPILAVGPKEVGSMEFLEGVAAIVTDLTDLDSIISKLVNDQDYRTQLSKKSIERYNSLGTNDDIRKKFILSLLG